MEQITVGEVGLTITFLVGLIGGIGYLRNHLKEWIASALKEELGSIEKKIDKMQEQINEVGKDARKNFLVARLSDAERGNEWDEVERERFWEQYDVYCKNGGNSYIKDKVNKLKLERKI